ncbi:hypothetical protein [Paraburkholderia megapolitana]|uniref:hypothetical protein n=1 Tax=Paraburkholderia megapolitana TaxID=420953 RepID=UPI0038BD57B8
MEVPDMFGTMEAEVVIDEDDTLKLFTVNGPRGQFLVYESTIDLRDRIIRYVAVPLHVGAVEQLIAGKITLLDALDQDTVWAIDHSFDGAHTSSVKLQNGLSSVPDGYKPEPGVRLQADHHYSS